MDKGGAAKIAGQIFEKFQGHYDLYFAYGRGKKNSVKNTFYFGNKIECIIHVFFVRFVGLEGFGSYFATRKLISFIKKENFDLVNIHNLHGYYLNFVTLLKFLEKRKIPIIYSIHDEWPITWMPAHSMGCNHCKTGEGRCLNTYSYPKSYHKIFAKYLLKRKKRTFLGVTNMTIVTPSFWLKESIDQSYLANFETRVIYHGIDTDIFKPAKDKNKLRIKYNLPIDKKIVIFSIASLKDKNKGLNFILKVAEILNKDYLFLGLGRGDISGISNIKTMGYIKDLNKIADLYTMSDVFIITSTAETFSLTSVEAMLSGIPVVGFDIPVLQEIIPPEIGMLIKEDTKDFSKAIMDASKEGFYKYDPTLIEKFSEKRFINDYKEIFDSV